MQGARAARGGNRPQTVLSRTEAAPARRLPAAARNSRLLVLGAIYLLLILIFLRTGLSLNMLGAAGLIAWGVQALPAIAFLPGLHKSRPRSYAWLGFAIQLYFIHGVVLAFSPARLGWGLAQILLCALVFVGLVAFIRFRRREHGAGSRIP